MKYCPICRTEYADATLNFCLEDGENLVDITEPENETQILGSPSGASLRSQGDFANSIAVLPFADWSNDPDNQHFCDGLAEDILNALTRIEALKVASCTSSFYFKGKDVTAAEMGRQLGVETILDGSVRRAGDRLRITLQLVRLSDGVQIWSEQYDRTIGDVFEIQDELTRLVVEAITPILLTAVR